MTVIADFLNSLEELELVSAFIPLIGNQGSVNNVYPKWLHGRCHDAAFHLGVSETMPVSMHQPTLQTQKQLTLTIRLP